MKTSILQMLLLCLLIEFPVKLVPVTSVREITLTSLVLCRSLLKGSQFTTVKALQYIQRGASQGTEAIVLSLGEETAFCLSVMREWVFVFLWI